jgi:hypothetical protein
VTVLDQRTLSATPAGAGWYSDPIDPSRLRWWDGSSWTARLAATKPSGPTQRGVQTFAPRTGAAVPPSPVDAPTPTLQFPVIEQQTPPATGGVSLATDPIASLEGMFAIDRTDDSTDAASRVPAEMPAPAPASVVAAGPAAPPAATPSAFPARSAALGTAAIAAAALGAAAGRRASTPLPVPAPDAPADDAPLFLTDALSAELGLPGRRRAVDPAASADAAAFVPGGRRARRHAEAMAAMSTTAPLSASADASRAGADSASKPAMDALEAAVDATVVPDAVEVDVQNEAQIEAEAGGTEADELATASTPVAEPLTRVTPALVEPTVDPELGDTAELLARLNLLDDAPRTAALPVAEADHDIADAPVAPVPAASGVDAPSVLPAVAPAFALPAELRAPAEPSVRTRPSAPAQTPTPAPSDDDLNEFAGVFGPLTPRNRDKVDVTEPTRWTTGSAWVLALSPVLTAAIAVGTALLAITGSINEAQTRWYVIGANLVLLAVLLLSTIADRRALRAAGYPSTASEFWLLLTPLAYLIARTVSVRSVLGRGGAPLWTHIGLTAAAGALGVGAMLMPQLTPASVESQYEAALEQALGAEGTVATVTCPADITGTSGATYACSGVTGDGTVLSIAVEMQDEGRFAYTVTDPAAG